MNFKALTLATAAVALGAAAPAAGADTLVTAAPGAQNLAAGGGFLVWSQPAEGGGFQLVVRRSDGTTTVPQIPRFRTAPDASIGSTFTGGDAGSRRIVATYSRDGDVFTLDLNGPAEEQRVPGASSSAYEETAPGVELGRFTFVRRGGRDNGVFALRDGRLRKITSARPRELAFNGSRVAYTSGQNVVIRRVSGRGTVATVPVPGGKPAFGLVLTRYALTFAAPGGRLFQTDDFGGSSRNESASTAREASQAFPASLNSVAFSRVFVRYYADGEGIKRIGTQNVFRR